MGALPLTEMTVKATVLGGCKGGCRIYYKTMLQHKYFKTRDGLKSQIKWNNDLQCQLEWDLIYNRFSSCTKNTTLRWYQDRLVHRILTTNVFVSKFTEESPLCTFCNADRETLLHLFAECEQVQCVWRAMVSRVRERLHYNVVLSKRAIIVGFEENETFHMADAAAAIQRLFLLGKYYIYRTKVAQHGIGISDMFSFCDFMTRAEFGNMRVGMADTEKKKVEVHQKLCLISYTSHEQGQRA